MTQWLSSCACDSQAVSTADTTVEPTIDLCKKCGKRSREGRVGSFTQFIFRYDLCACEYPEFTEQVAQMQPAVMPLMDGEVFDDSEEAIAVNDSEFPAERYKPIRLTGKGSSGAVYVCRDRLLNKLVAVKILHRLSSEDVIGFQREAVVLSKLEHPNIVKVLDFGTTDSGNPYMVLEYMDGISLRAKLDEEGPMSWPNARQVFLQLADGLIYCHDRQVFHRDLKPENILFVGDENSYTVKLIDFGIAFIKSEGVSGTSKQLAGTPSYMAPDQALGLVYDSRSELYSFGCVLYEALTGQPPFLADTALEVISMHANDKAAPLSTFTGADMSEAEKFLSKCLAKKPGDRFFSMKRVHEALLNLEMKDRAQAAANEQSRTAESNLIPLTSIVPAVSEGVSKSWATVMISVILAVVSGTAAIFFLNQHNTKVETTFSPLLEDELEVSRGAGKAKFELIQEQAGTYMASGSIGKKAFTKIANNPRVRKLHFSPSAEIDWKSMPLLVNARITEMSFHFVAKVNDDSIQYLESLRFLRHLSLSETKITDKCIPSLTRLRKLKALTVSHTALTGALLQEIPKLRHLTNLHIAGIHNITPEDIHSLQALPKLDKLEISSNPISDDCAREIGGLNISKLEANDCNLSDKGIAALSRLPLISLAIGANPKLTNHSLDILKDFKDLKLLKLAGLPNVSPKKIAEFKASRPDVLLIQETQYEFRGSKLGDMLEHANSDYANLKERRPYVDDPL